MSARSLPVLMYHYISRFPGATTVSPEHFEEQCRGMSEHGWRGISLEEAESYLLRGEAIPPRSLLITFDDGYLDNYVYAWPILQRYGHHGVIFAVTERLEKNLALRPTLADCWNNPATLLPPVDEPMHTHPAGFVERRDLFLSWEEARHMESSGVMRIAAHSARHLAVYAGSEWGHANRHDRRTAATGLNALGQRFRVPGTRLNTFYQIDGPQPWGLPRFKERPFLHSTAFIPSEELLNGVTHLVPQDADAAYAFFRNPEAVARLESLVASIPPERLGAFESPEQRRERIHTELSLCRNALYRELGQVPVSLCWPWGSGSDVAREEAERLGFSVFFTTGMGANLPGHSKAVHRFKVRDAGWSWLRLRLEIYARPWLATLYKSCRI